MLGDNFCYTNTAIKLLAGTNLKHYIIYGENP